MCCLKNKIVGHLGTNILKGGLRLLEHERGKEKEMRWMKDGETNNCFLGEMVKQLKREQFLKILRQYNNIIFFCSFYFSQH